MFQHTESEEHVFYDLSIVQIDVFDSTRKVDMVIVAFPRVFVCYQ